ncbi:MAG: CcmD family protein [Desulfovibrio sp.]|nr:CcmD family protein [Desulfovibrio sp.]
MEPITYLFAANCIVWIGFAGYSLFLASRQKHLERFIKRLERKNGNVGD